MNNTDDTTKAMPQGIIKLTPRQALTVAVEKQFGGRISKSRKRAIVDYNLAQPASESNSRQRRRALARQGAKK